MSVKKLLHNDFKKRYFSTIPLLGFIAIYLFVGIIATVWIDKTGITISNIVFIIFNYCILLWAAVEILRLNYPFRQQWIIWLINFVFLSFLYLLPLNKDQQNFYFFNQIDWKWLKFWMLIVIYFLTTIILFLTSLLKFKISVGKNLGTIILLIVLTISIKSFNQFMLNAGQYGWSIFVWLLLIAMATDTFAFLGGISFGRTPLAPSISPKKTIEGVVIGCSVATILGAGYAILLLNFHSNDGQVILRNNISSTTSLYIIYCFLPLILSVLAVIGDLCFSMIKRFYNIKDFSNIIPGHGGLLDRLDSIIVVFFTIFILTSALGG